MPSLKERLRSKAVKMVAEDRERKMREAIILDEISREEARNESRQKSGRRVLRGSNGEKEMTRRNQYEPTISEQLDRIADILTSEIVNTPLPSQRIPELVPETEYETEFPQTDIDTESSRRTTSSSSSSSSSAPSSRRTRNSRQAEQMAMLTYGFLQGALGRAGQTGAEMVPYVDAGVRNGLVPMAQAGAVAIADITRELAPLVQAGVVNGARGITAIARVLAPLVQAGVVNGIRGVHQIGTALAPVVQAGVVRGVRGARQLATALAPLVRDGMINGMRGASEIATAVVPYVRRAVERPFAMPPPTFQLPPYVPEPPQPPLLQPIGMRGYAPISFVPTSVPPLPPNNHLMIGRRRASSPAPAPVRAPRRTADQIMLEENARAQGLRATMPQNIDLSSPRTERQATNRSRRGEGLRRRKK